MNRRSLILSALAAPFVALRRRYARPAPQFVTTKECAWTFKGRPGAIDIADEADADDIVFSNLGEGGCSRGILCIFDEKGSGGWNIVLDDTPPVPDDIDAGFPRVS